MFSPNIQLYYPFIGPTTDKQVNILVLKKIIHVIFSNVSRLRRN